MSPRSLIFADIGNSQTKLAVSWPHCPDWIDEQTAADPAHFREASIPRGDWFLVSVNRQRRQALLDWIERHRPGDRHLTLSRHDFPLRLAIDHPESVGVDRIASAWAAVGLNGGVGPVLIVSVGTAVTIDAVNSQGEFAGGLIFPGPFACFQALSRSTDQLPQIFAADVPVELLGKSTQSAIASGVWYLQIGGILHILAQLRALEEYRVAKVFLTGGGAGPLVSRFPAGTDWVRNLVLKGIAAVAAQAAKRLYAQPRLHGG